MKSKLLLLVMALLATGCHIPLDDELVTFVVKRIEVTLEPLDGGEVIHGEIIFNYSDNKLDSIYSAALDPIFSKSWDIEPYYEYVIPMKYDLDSLESFTIPKSAETETFSYQFHKSQYKVSIERDAFYSWYGGNFSSKATDTKTYQNLLLKTKFKHYENDKLQSYGRQTYYYDDMNSLRKTIGTWADGKALTPEVYHTDYTLTYSEDFSNLRSDSEYSGSYRLYYYKDGEVQREESYSKDKIRDMIEYEQGSPTKIVDEDFLDYKVSMDIEYGDIEPIPQSINVAVLGLLHHWSTGIFRFIDFDGLPRVFHHYYIMSI